LAQAATVSLWVQKAASNVRSSHVRPKIDGACDSGRGLAAHEPLHR